jgi:acid phosphatase family membrane protein YuiD
MPQDGWLYNPVLFAALTAWSLAQVLKIPIEYLNSRQTNWALLFSAGGMPSSHSALMVATTLSVGLFYGFNNPLFAVALAVSMIVLYDATGVRRQAGYHAQKINLLFNELFSGQPICDKQLKEVLGHSPLEVLGGTILGILVAILYRLVL